MANSTLKSDYFASEASYISKQTAYKWKLMECKDTVLKRHLMYKMNRKVEHYLLVGHSRNALRNYSNQIAAAALLLSENLLVEKQAN